MTLRETSALIRDYSESQRDEVERQKRQRTASSILRTQTSAMREAARFYETYWSFFYHVRGRWENITGLDLRPQEVIFKDTLMYSAVPVGRLTGGVELCLLTIFQQLFPDSFWKTINLATQVKIDAASLNPKTGLPSFLPLQPDACKRYLLAMIEFRALHFNITADEYFNAKDISNKSKKHAIATCRRWGLSSLVFWRIAGFLSGDVYDLSRSLETALRAWILSFGNAVLDESLVSCRTKDAPSVVITRKPHPCGIRFYLVCTVLPASRRSFPFRIIPDLSSDSKLRVIEIFQKAFDDLKNEAMTKRFPFNVTMDAFFSISDLLRDDYPFNPLRFTASWNKARQKELWKCLFYGLQPREYRSVTDGTRFASAFRDQADMAVLSNAFELVSSLNVSVEEPSPPQTPPPVESSNVVQQTTCSACLRPISIGVDGMKCNGCPYGRHTSCQQATSLGGFSFCTRACRVQWIRRLQEEAQEELPPISNSTLQFLLRSPRVHLENLCAQYNRPVLDGTARGMAYSLCGYDELPQLEAESSSSSEIPEPSEVLPTILGDPPSEDRDSSEDELSEEESLSDDEQPLSLRTIRQRIRKYGIEPHQKEEMATKQLYLLQMQPEEKALLVAEFDSFNATTAHCPTGIKPPLQKFYGETMSGVDTLDRRFYELFRAPKSKNWTAIAIYSVILYGILGMHALICESRSDRRHFDWSVPGPINFGESYDSVSFVKDLLEALKKS
jgi:hypothetical protein